MKELEALYRLATRNNGNRRSDEEVDKDFRIVEKALNDYESIGNANPSEALKELNNIISDFDELEYVDGALAITGNYLVQKFKGLATIKQALMQKSKKEQALEIIKKKLVDVFKLYNCKTVEEYNQAQYRDCRLTEEEFNILKEGIEE